MSTRALKETRHPALALLACASLFALWRRARRRPDGRRPERLRGRDPAGLDPARHRSRSRTRTRWARGRACPGAACARPAAPPASTGRASTRWACSPRARPTRSRSGCASWPGRRPDAVDASPCSGRCPLGTASTPSPRARHRASPTRAGCSSPASTRSRATDPTGAPPVRRGHRRDPAYYIDDFRIDKIADPAGPPPNTTGLSSTFESGTTEGWTSRTGTEVVAVSTADAHSGTTSLLTTNRTATFRGPNFNVTNVMFNGSRYRVSLWAKLAPGLGAAPAAAREPPAQRGHGHDVPHRHRQHERDRGRLGAARRHLRRRAGQQLAVPLRRVGQLAGRRSTSTTSR